MPGKRYYLFFLLLLLSIPSYSNAQWQQVFNLETNCINSNNGTLYAGSVYGLYESTNNGSTWNINNQVGGVIFNILFFDNDMIINWGNRFAKSTNGGQTWTNVMLPHNIYSIAGDGTTFYVGTYEDGVYKSTNGGANFQSIGTFNATVRSLVINDNKIFAGTLYSGLYSSTNEGGAWNHQFSGISVGCLAVYDSKIFAGTAGHGLFMSTNNGEKWISTSLDTGNISTIFSFGTNLFVGSDFEGEGFGVYKSEDNFQTWTVHNEGLPDRTVRTLHISNNYFFSGNENSIHRRPLAQIVSVLPISTEVPDDYSLNQNYPNPFNPSTKITFAISKAGNVKMLIYDHLGREVATILNEELSSGTYEKEFDGASLSSGIYYYKLITGEFSETKKMVLVK